MKRKFIGVALFSTMLLAPAGTFVSCSDYDDDISDLNNRIDALKGDLTTVINGKMETVATDIANLKSAQEGLDQAYKNADAALKASYEEADKKLQEAIASGDKEAIAQATALVNALQEKVTAGDVATLKAAEELVKKAQTDLQTALDNCKNACDQKYSDHETRIQALVAADAQLSTAIQSAQAAAESATTLAQKAQTTADEALALAKKNEGSLAELVSKLQTSSNQLGEVEGKLNTANNSLSELSSKYSTLSEELQEKGKQIADNEAAIKAQETALEAYKKVVATTVAQAQQNAVTEAVKKAADDASSKLSDAQKAYADAVKKLEEAGGNIANLKQEYETLLRAYVTGEDFNQLKSDIAKQNEDFTRKLQELQKQKEDLSDKLTQAIGTHTSDVTKIYEEFEKVNTEIGNVNTKIDSKILDVTTLLQNALNGTAEQKGVLTRIQELESSNSGKVTMAEVQDKYDETLKNLRADLTKLTNTVDGFTDEDGNLVFVDKDGKENNLNETIQKLVANLGTQGESINTLNATLAKALRSLVFKPSLYVGGVESMEYAYVKYAQLVPGTTTKEFEVGGKKYKLEKGWNYVEKTQNGTVQYSWISPAQLVEYHMNPSNVNLNTLKNSHFIHRSAEFRATDAAFDAADTWFTAADGDNNIFTGVAAKTQNNGGVLQIGVKLPSDKDVELYDNGKTIMALQTQTSTEKDAKGENILQTITSDYARLTTTRFMPKAVSYPVSAFNNQNAGVACNVSGEKQLYATAEDALKGEVLANVDPSVGLNIDVFGIHYAAAGTPNNHKSVDHAHLANLGMKVSYELVKYQTGDDVTNDSYANYTDADQVKAGKIISMEGKNNFALGRRPLVRVTVTEGSNVVMVGFFTVLYTRSEENVNIEGKDFGTKKYSCNENQTNELDWEWVSNKILEAHNISASEFKNGYTADTYTSGNLTVYNDAACKNAAADGVFGDVKMVSAGGVQTTTFTWTLDPTAQLAVFKEAGHKKTVYVQLKKNHNDDNTTGGNIIIPMTVTVDRAYLNAANGDAVVEKVPSLWKDGKYFSLNIDQPETGKFVSNASFVTPFAYGFVGGQPGYKKANGNATSYWYYFVPNNAAYTYKTDAGEVVTKNEYDSNNTQKNFVESGNIVATDAKWLHATKVYKGATLIAEITSENKVKYANSAEAKDLLNGASGEGLTFTVGIGGANDCEALYMGGHNTFDVLAYRPITMVKGNLTPSVTDADVNTYRMGLSRVVAFKDWRNVEFESSSSPNLYTYYQVSKLTIDGVDASGIIDASKVKVAGTGKTLKEVYGDRFSFSYTQGTISKGQTAGSYAWGSLTYKKNDQKTVESDITLEFTAKVKYGFSGSKYFEVPFNVVIKKSIR